MDRTTVYPAEQATDTDVLSASKFAMVGLAYLAQAVLGANVVADGLPCTPGMGLNVSIGQGSIYALVETDATGYGSLGTDTAQIVKQGLNKTVASLAVPAPAGAGNSVNYLIEAQYQDVDTGNAALPYFNSADPTVPYTGPGGSGGMQPTIRSGVCALQVKAGVAATTGTQVTPAADAGWTGLFVVTVANGQSSIVTGNISTLLGAPFIPAKLPAMVAGIQNSLWTYAADTGAVNALAATIAPAPQVANMAALPVGTMVSVKIANTNTATGVTLNLNGLGAETLTSNGAAPAVGSLIAGQILILQWDGTDWQIKSTIVVAASQTAPGIVRIATDIEALAEALNSVALSPSNLLALFAQSLGVSGFITFPGGMILQWGQATAALTSEGAVSVSWPTTFPNACWRALTIIRNTSSSINNDTTVQEVSLSTTTGNFFVQDTNPSFTDAAGGFGFIALGN